MQPVTLALVDAAGIYLPPKPTPVSSYPLAPAVMLLSITLQGGAGPHEQQQPPVQQVTLALVDAAGPDDFLDLVRGGLTVAMEALPPGSLFGLIGISDCISLVDMSGGWRLTVRAAKVWGSGCDRQGVREEGREDGGSLSLCGPSGHPPHVKRAQFYASAVSTAKVQQT